MENHRKRKEMDRSNKSGNIKRSMEETCEWPYSPKGETEISQVQVILDRNIAGKNCMKADTVFVLKIIWQENGNVP